MSNRPEAQRHPYEFSKLVLLLYGFIDGLLSEGKRPDKHIKEHQRKIAQAYDAWDTLKTTSSSIRENLSNSITKTTQELSEAYHILSQAEKTWDDEDSREYREKSASQIATGKDSFSVHHRIRNVLYTSLWVLDEKVSSDEKKAKLIQFLSQLDKGCIRWEEPKAGNTIPIDLDLRWYPRNSEAKQVGHDLERMARQYVTAQFIEILIGETKKEREEGKKRTSLLDLPAFFAAEVQKIRSQLDSYTFSSKSLAEMKEYVEAKLAEEWQYDLEIYGSSYYSAIDRLKHNDTYFDDLVEKYKVSQEEDYAAVSEVLDIQFHLQKITAYSKSIYTSERIYVGMNPAVDEFMKKAIKNIVKSCNKLITTYKKYFSPEELAPLVSFVRNTNHISNTMWVD